MPYITPDQKENFLGLATLNPKTAGELNYVLTQVCRKYFYNNGARYQQINDVVGALEGSKLEFYRRLAALYEDNKIQENGDVYERTGSDIT